MDYLSRDSRTIFLGQAVAEPGTAMSNTLKNVPKEKLIELPVAEEMQMGMSLGLAFDGKIPISIYPRWNFLLCAVNQLINHVDKFPYLCNGFNSKVIVRTSIGSERPLHPNFQHIGDFTESFKLMCKTIEIIRLDDPSQIFPAYERALLREDNRSTILVEWGDFYNEK
jgi:pyruvate/2-oxoglutarate/acetoin dehydrogenase E1 component